MDEIELVANISLARNETNRITDETARTVIFRLLEMITFLQEQISELQDAGEDE
jgi:hypothetical protein